MHAPLSAAIAARLTRLTIELPSWGFADTGTRFGKFLQDAAALTLDDKLDDAAEVHRLTGACPSVAIHVLWDMPAGGALELAALAQARGLRIGSINPTLFQDQCYKHGSVANEDASRRGPGHWRRCWREVRSNWSDQSARRMPLTSVSNRSRDDSTVAVCPMRRMYNVRPGAATIAPRSIMSGRGAA